MACVTRFCIPIDPFRSSREQACHLSVLFHLVAVWSFCFPAFFFRASSQYHLCLVVPVHAPSPAAWKLVFFAVESWCIVLASHMFPLQYSSTNINCNAWKGRITFANHYEWVSDLHIKSLSSNRQVRMIPCMQPRHLKSCKVQTWPLCGLTPGNARNTEWKLAGMYFRASAFDVPSEHETWCFCPMCSCGAQYQ